METSLPECDTVYFGKEKTATSIFMAELLEFQCRQGYILAYFLCTMDVLRRQWHRKGRH
jgi:hypothetical protein